MGKSLELYLKDNAIIDNLGGETRVYLVKDDDDDIVLFFSLKCGLLYEKDEYSDLNDKKRQYVDRIIKAKLEKDNESLEKFYSTTEFNPNEINRLFEIADKRIDLKKNNVEITEADKSHKVKRCFSAIELQHFCKNASYIPKVEIIAPIGFGVFGEIIAPLVCKINEKIGCKYLYLFAADKTNINNKMDLVEYYKGSLKFSDVEDVTVVKPDYDIGCYSLYQEISELAKNREIVWQQFSDALGGLE